MRWQILTLEPMLPWPGVRRGMLKDKSKFSRFIHLIGMHLISMHLMSVHLMGVHLMGVYFMSMHLIGVHLISLCLIPLSGKCDPRFNLWALTGGTYF
jgi:hypothetical protein